MQLLSLKKLSSFTILCLFALFAFYSCQEKRPTLNQPDIEKMPTGKVTGTVMSQNGSTPIGGAKVFIDVIGNVFMTKTNSEGNFTLEAPEGEHTLHIQTGNGNIFRTSIDVVIQANKTISISNDEGGESTVELFQVADLAYIEGQYDAVENIIIDTLGYSATEITVSDLDNLNTLQQYSAIFLNCGKYNYLDSLKYTNLESYVQGGGSLYASDWAVNYLVGDGYYKRPPQHHTPAQHTMSAHNNARADSCTAEIGGFIPDTDLCTEKDGISGYVNGADVLASDIQTVLGKNTMDIHYDLGAWEVIHELNNWEVLIEDNNSYGPLAVRTNLSNSSNNNNNQNTQSGWVTICHVPPGNPSNAHTITISVNALNAHLNHGDSIGPCSGDGGNIYYTTFHNEEQANLNDDMEKVLNYFILNL